MFSAPIDSWTPKYSSIPPLVESITGLDFPQGGKIYAWANFDYVSNPNESDVDEHHMREGFPHVFHVLTTAKPRVIVPVTHKASILLRECLEERGASLEEQQTIGFPIGSRRYSIEVWKLLGLSREGIRGTLVARLPQHPRRLGSSAGRAGRKIHGMLQRASP